MEHTSIIAKNKKRYPLGCLKTLFITSEQTLDEFCENYKISASHLLKYYKEQNWENLREKSREDAGTVAQELVLEHVKDAFNLEMQINALMTLQVRNHVDYLIRYYNEYGDLFSRNSVGEIIMDGFGNPIPLRIPNTPKDIMSRKNNMELLLTLGQLTQQNQTTAININSEKEKKKLSSEYMHFLKSNDDNETN